MVALASVTQKLQQAATELGKDIITDIVLALEEFDGPASTHLSYALRLCYFFQLLIREEKKGDNIKVMRKQEQAGRHAEQEVASMLRLPV